MLIKEIEPRLSETDAIGHINNNYYSIWFEQAREPIFRLFSETLDLKELNLIMAHISCDFISEVFYGRNVIIKTAIEKLGNSSIHVKHALYQDNKLCTTGKAVLIHFDYKTKKSISIPSDKREYLEKLIYEDKFDTNLK